MANPDGALGGAYNPRTDYVRTGATDTGGTYASATLTGATLTGATLSAGGAVASPIITGDAGTGTIFCKQALFTEDATSLTHTATFVIPAGSTLLDIIVVPQVLWTGGTAAFTCGVSLRARAWMGNPSAPAL